MKSTHKCSLSACCFVIVISLCTVSLSWSARAFELRFVVMSDCHYPAGADRLETIMDQIMNEYVDLIVVTGDMTSSDNESGLRSWFDFMRGYLEGSWTKLLVVRGNHELPIPKDRWIKVLQDNGDLLAARPTNINKLNYHHYFLEIYNFVMLDLAGVNPEFAIDTFWGDLFEGMTPHFFFGHAPIYAGYYGTNATVSNGGELLDVLYTTKEWAGFGGYYFCGHEHFFNHLELALSSESYPSAFQVVNLPSGGTLRTKQHPYYSQNTQGWKVLRDDVEGRKSGYVLVRVDELTNEIIVTPKSPSYP